MCNPKHDSHITFHSAQAGGSFSLFLSHQHHLCNPPSSFKIPDRDAGITDQNRENPRSYRVRPSVPIFDFVFFVFFGLAELLVMMKSSNTHGKDNMCVVVYVIVQSCSQNNYGIHHRWPSMALMPTHCNKSELFFFLSFPFAFLMAGAGPPSRISVVAPSRRFHDPFYLITSWNL